ncbi:MAG: WGR domain-containing protein [Kofleriaceae bacterium]
MPRYEQAGEFFWVIELEGTVVTTSVGKLGKSGHTRLKEYDSSSEAKREYAAAIAEKIEQGYVLVGEAKAKPKAKPKG